MVSLKNRILSEKERTSKLTLKNLNVGIGYIMEDLSTFGIDQN